MATRKQIEAARRNGARSRGPVTAEGKKRSSANAITHGFYSREVVLPTENLDKFMEFKQEYLVRYQPETRDEIDLAEEIIMCRWRLIRLWTAECASLETQMQELLPKIKEACESFTPATHLGVAWCAGEKQLAHFRRLEASLSRQALQADKRLRELIEIRLAAQPELPEPVAQPAPEPAPEPYVETYVPRPPQNLPPPVRGNEPPAVQPSSNQHPPADSPVPIKPAA